MNEPHTDGFFFDALRDHASGAYSCGCARVPSRRRVAFRSSRDGRRRGRFPHTASSRSRRFVVEANGLALGSSRRVAFLGLVRWVETDASRFRRRGTTDGADGARDVDVVVRARASIEDDDDGEVDGWEGEGERVRDRGASRATGVRRARGKGGRGGFLSARARLEARRTRGRVEETGGGGE